MLSVVEIIVEKGLYLHQQHYLYCSVQLVTVRTSASASSNASCFEGVSRHYPNG